MSGLTGGFPVPEHDKTPCDAAVGVRFHGPRPRPGRGASSFLTVFQQAAGYPGPGSGWNRVTCGMPVTVFLVTAVCGKPGRAFCARRECR